MERAEWRQSENGHQYNVYDNKGPLHLELVLSLCWSRGNCCRYSEYITAGLSGFDSWHHRCVQTGSGAHSVCAGGSLPRIKRLELEADLSAPSSAEVKKAWSFTSTSPYVFMSWCLINHRHNFTFTCVLADAVFHYLVACRLYYGVIMKYFVWL
jgi:hypothetical protein